MKQYKTTNKRLRRYLYVLGFEHENEFKDDKEVFVFEDDERLRKCIGFFYEMRKTFWKKKFGVNENK